MFLDAYGIKEDWIKYRSPNYEPNDDIVIPCPVTVNKFFNDEYSNDKYISEKQTH